jgi:hypothetical protein
MKKALFWKISIAFVAVFLLALLLGKPGYSFDI